MDLQVLVVIDVAPASFGLPTKAYVAVEEVHDVRRLFASLAPFCTAEPTSSSPPLPVPCSLSP